MKNESMSFYKTIYNQNLSVIFILLMSFLISFFHQDSFAANKPISSFSNFVTRPLTIIEKTEPSLIFDLPVEYNNQVKKWIHYFQTRGQSHFKLWLERYSRVSKPIQDILTKEKLPKDLIYMSMIESGFSFLAVSSAAAVGPWQFIRETGQRFGLRINWWLDERRDLYKSTKAASEYIKYLYQLFGSWYLVAAAYNTGENRVKRLMKKHKTRNFWILARKRVLHSETINYVPKMIAAMLIAKAPGLYGFRDLNHQQPDYFEYFVAPGGLYLSNLAKHLNVSSALLKRLNPELILFKIPSSVRQHRIRIPSGSSYRVSQYLRAKLLGKRQLAQRD